MNEKLKNLTYKLENILFLTVIRHSLTMMIPFILIGGISCALINLPFADYSITIGSFKLMWLHDTLETVYNGTFGLFSLLLAFLLAVCYGMERNKSVDAVATYIIVALGAYGVQLHIGTNNFNIDDLGVKGSFSAMFIVLFACYFFEKFKKIAALSMRKFSVGMESLCANAIQTILPMTLVLGMVLIFTHTLQFFFGVYNLHDLFSTLSCKLFEDMNSNFITGLLYTFVLHLLWILGFHGSHLLEPVAQTVFLPVSSTTIFSKSFFDTYVVMGGCGTTICVLILLLVFFKKDRMHNLAKIGFFPVIFNLNEILNFGLPIVLNPVMAIPFLLTPIVSYCIAYGATFLGLVPPITQTIPWSTPILLNSYIGTGSLRGFFLQLVCITIGMAIYYPFLRMHKKVQELYSREKLKALLKEMKELEEKNETPKFLTRADSIGLISRMLLEDLKVAIEQDELYMLYQPQVDNTGVCLGAEALLRWNHPLYGSIYPPFILYLAKEGGILEQLEKKIFDKASEAIYKTGQEYDGEFKISINITAKSLFWDIETYISECLNKYNISPKRLWVEITEQDMISNADFVIDKLKRLKNYGHVLLIDDFGMGHTSLIYLQSNYFGVVKLDGSLITHLEDNPTNQKIVASIVELGNELDVKVIAEYVETDAQQQMLEQLGCNWYQGYLYSKPLTLDDFITYIKEFNAKVTK